MIESPIGRAGQRSGPVLARGAARVGPVEAEQEGFEPSVRLTPYTGLAIRPLQPLGHRPGMVEDSRSRRV